MMVVMGTTSLHLYTMLSYNVVGSRLAMRFACDLHAE